MQASIGFDRASICMACATTVQPGQLLCPACGCPDLTVGKVQPWKLNRDRDGIPLGPIWDVLGTWPAGNVVSLSGGPGSGKSTIAGSLDVAAWLTSEQSPREAAIMLARVRPDRKLPPVWSTRQPADVAEALDDTSAGIVVLDSLTQLADWTGQAAVLERLIRWTREKPGRRVLVIQQVNGEGRGAGLLEIPHMVDAVCAIESVHGMRALKVTKNRAGPLSSRLFVIGANGAQPPALAQLASYSVEGEPGSYRLHPWPLEGAKWGGLFDARWQKRPARAGLACAARVVKGYAGDLLHPFDHAERRAFAEAHGLTWIAEI